ncbi:protein kinase [Lineolata rhizophorae]|uniref:non-specific serine/threonine protein kinase n=1 Tax=Lineolata rhizophorae TaxID=578093 RepID=A0A6A6NWL6_9PEZI|nr:protein kinase [Lineolata rhizophorae]
MSTRDRNLGDKVQHSGVRISSIPLHGSARFGFIRSPLIFTPQSLPPRHSVHFPPIPPVRTTASRPRSPPRKFAESGFVQLNVAEKIEEEDIPGYNPEDYYPARIGDVFESRYQLVSKLGFGVNSTVWLCRDLLEHRYLTLKLRVRAKRDDHVRKHDDQEVTVSHHLNNMPIEHPGKKMIRTVVDSFEVSGPCGSHKCLLYRPLGMNFTELLNLLPEKRFSKELFQRNVSPNNILQNVEDDSVLSQMEQGEIKQPIARKILNDRVIYNSRPMPLSKGLPILCDFGEARIGNRKHRGDIMPGIYRAPEVILGMEWDTKVDIWSIGVIAWNLLEGSNLFFARASGLLNDEQHLAEMVSLMGPPPPEFLRRSEKCRQYWDDQGNWKGSIPIPDQSFEIRERWLSDEDRNLFLRFMRRIVRWMPEDRPTAEELAYDDFLMQPYLASHPEMRENDA